MDRREFDELRAHYASTLVDLGTGDGAWPRRFAREYSNVLAVGIDSNRAALGEASKLAERKPARGGAPNALYIAARAESLPHDLQRAADWITIYFPWSALLKLILAGDALLGDILNSIAAPRAKLSIVLNAEAAPDGFERPTPDEVRKSLSAPLEAASFRITRAGWLDASAAPPTTWGGRLVKGSRRAMIGVEAQR